MKKNSRAYLKTISDMDTLIKEYALKNDNELNDFDKNVKDIVLHKVVEWRTKVFSKYGIN